MQEKLFMTHLWLFSSVPVTGITEILAIKSSTSETQETPLDGEDPWI